jgi:hypothetical protein
MPGDSQSSSAQVVTNARYQFSIRGLLVLTFAACVSLTIASLCRGSEWFGGLASPWTWVTLSMIVASWIFLWRIESPRWVLRSSIILYSLSLALPAIAFVDVRPGSDIGYGFRLWATSFMGSWGCIHDWIYPPPPSWFNISLGVCLPIACFLGLIANVAAPASWIAVYIARRKQKPPVLARRLAWASLAAMLSSIVLLSCAIPVPVLLPGYGLWVVSVLALATNSK